MRGGGILKVPWWKKLAADKQLKVAVEAILSVARVRRLHESGRHKWRYGGTEGGARKGKGRGEAGIIGIMGQRPVTYRWADDPVQKYNRGRCRGCWGRRWLTSPEGHWTAVRKGGSGQE